MNLGQLIGELRLKAEIAAASPRPYVRRERAATSQSERILAALRDTPEGLTVKDLATAIAAAPASTNTVVGILRRAGRVTLAHPARRNAGASPTNPPRRNPMNAPASPIAAAGTFQMLGLDELVPSTTRVQERRRARFTPESLAELAESLRGGMIEPIVARPRPDLGDFAAEIVAGERRWRAARLAGLDTVPVVVRDYTDEDALRVQLVENLQREDLNPLDEAEGYAELMERGSLKPDDLVRLTGKSRSWVYSRLQLLKLGEPAKAAIAEGRIDASTALVIAKYEHQQAEKALQIALDNDFSVRELEEELEFQFRKPAPPPPRPEPRELTPEEKAEQAAYEKSMADRQRDHEREERQAEAEQAFRIALFKAVAAKARGPLTTAEIIDLAREEAHNLDDRDIALMYGDKGLPDITKLKLGDLGYLIRMAQVASNLSRWSDGAALLALAKRLKVDVQKIRAAAKKSAPKK